MSPEEAGQEEAGQVEAVQDRRAELAAPQVAENAHVAPEPRGTPEGHRTSQAGEI